MVSNDIHVHSHSHPQHDVIVHAMTTSNTHTINTEEKVRRDKQRQQNEPSLWEKTMVNTNSLPGKASIGMSRRVAQRLPSLFDDATTNASSAYQVVPTLVNRDYDDGKRRRKRKHMAMFGFQWTRSIAVRLCFSLIPFCLLFSLRIHFRAPYLLLRNDTFVQSGTSMQGYYPRMVLYERHGGRDIVTKIQGTSLLNHTQSESMSSSWQNSQDLGVARQEATEQKPAFGFSSDMEDDTIRPLETHHCQTQQPWQKENHMTCNVIHELDVGTGLAHGRTDVDHMGTIQMAAHGFWRDVWILPDLAEHTQQRRYVLKTLRYVHNYEPRNYDRHRRDALASERLTQSPHIVDIYAHCGNSGFFESGQGDMTDALWPKVVTVGGNTTRVLGNLTKLQKLQMGLQAAQGVAAVHNIDHEGRPSIAHTDISPAQFVLIGGVYKLSDFNRARFLHWDPQTGQICQYFVGNNPGKNRSPEEYSYGPQTEKVDVYSLGNIFYMLLMQEWPFRGVKAEDAAEKVKKGFRPSFYADIWNSEDPTDQALKTAMMMCHEHNVTERSSSRQVEAYLAERLLQIEMEGMSTI